MIKRIFKVIALVFVMLMVVALGFYGYARYDLNNRKNKVYRVAPEPISVSYDSSSIALGERLAGTRACKECHGSDMGGKILVDDPLIGTFVTRNLTKGVGGLPKDFSESDWVMAMKHGLDRNGKPLYLMPSHELSQLSEPDMAALIAYCSQLPPVDRETPPLHVGALGTVLTELGLIPLLPAEMTDHTKPFPKPVMSEVSVAYGKYLSTICINCHGANLKGGESPVPGGKYVADITSTGNPGRWTHEQFINALHTGVTPEGKTLNPEEMPWTITTNFTNDELTALHLYLKSLK